MYHVWTRDLESNSTFEQPIINAGAEGGYYQERTEANEAWFEERLGLIESTASPVVARLVSNQWAMIDDEDLAALAVFLVTMFSRGPRVRRKLVEMPRLFLDAFAQRGDEPAPSLRSWLEGMENEDPVPVHSAVVLDTARSAYPELLRRSWSLVVSPVGLRFACSDSPVLIENPIREGFRSSLGLMVPGVILYLPLSPHLMLMVAHEVLGLRDRQVHHANTEQMCALQWLTGWNTQRFLYAREREDLILPEGSWQPGGHHLTFA